MVSKADKTIRLYTSTLSSTGISRKAYSAITGSSYNKHRADDGTARPLQTDGSNVYASVPAAMRSPLVVLNMGMARKAIGVSSDRIV